ncbi:DUF1127 domain-containing protein, partial [Marinobacter confluentis]
MSALSIFRTRANVSALANTPKESWIQRLNRWYANYRTRQQLARLPDFTLKDIGVSRIDAEHEASKA